MFTVILKAIPFAFSLFTVMKKIFFSFFCTNHLYASFKELTFRYITKGKKQKIPLKYYCSIA